MLCTSWVETLCPDIVVLRSSSSGNDEPSRPKSGSKKNGKGKKVGNRVLLVGRLRELALYRAEVLRHAGFVVHTPETIGEAIAVLKRREFDAIVLSYTLPSDTVQVLSDIAREHCPDCPVIAIAESYKFDRRINPDAVALANAGPPALIAALRQVMTSK